MPSVALLSSVHAAGKIEKRSYFFKDAGKEIDYRLYVPSSYKKESANPLIVILHGLGSNPHQVIRYNGVVQEAESRGYIVVACLTDTMSVGGMEVGEK